MNCIKDIFNLYDDKLQMSYIDKIGDILYNIIQVEAEHRKEQKLGNGEYFLKKDFQAASIPAA